MREDSTLKQAFVTAQRLLAASSKTRQELAAKLAQKGYAGEVIAEALGQLEKQKILDDRVYAQNLMNRFRFAQPSGRKKVLFEMKRHGVPAKVQEELLCGWDKTEELETARDVARQRWSRLEKLPELKRKKKIYDYLMRRGFEFQICRDVVSELSKGSLADESLTEDPGAL